MSDRSWFAMRCVDRPGTGALRAAAHPAHMAHLDAPPENVSIAVSGPLLGVDGEPTGSLIVFEAPSAAAVREYAKSDPLAIEGVWGSIEIDRFDWRRGRPE